MFYKDDNVKIVPENIKELLLSPFSLAVWLMEDGSYCARNKSTKVCTDCFTYREHEMLQDTLKCNFNLEAKIIKYTDKYFRLRFGAAEAQKIKTLVDEYFTEDMKYKLIQH